MNTPWDLERATLSDVREAAYEVAVLPFGATEPHNTHLPYGTDTLEATVATRAICAEAHAGGARIVRLPTIPYGTQRNMRGFPLALNVDPSTLLAFVDDIIESVLEAGIRKIVLFNAHGGNALKPLVRELQDVEDGAHLFVCDWLRVLGDDYDAVFDTPEDHAGEAETSFALAHFPELVARTAGGELDADAGTTRPFRFDAMNQGWISTSRTWDRLTTNSGSGNPHGATAAKGERLLELLVARVAPFLVELSAASIDDDFPFVPPGDDG